VLRSEVGRILKAANDNPPGSSSAFYNDRGLNTRVTTISHDMDRMGAAPGLQAQIGSYGLDTAQPFPQIPQGPQFGFGPLLPQRNNAAITNPGSDMRPNDWRSLLADMGKVDLNRPLTAFPVPGTNYTLPSGQQVPVPGPAGRRFDPNAAADAQWVQLFSTA